MWALCSLRAPRRRERGGDSERRDGGQGSAILSLAGRHGGLRLVGAGVTWSRRGACAKEKELEAGATRF